MGTATAIALLVDFGRMPVYVASESGELVRAWPEIATGIAGVVVGTWLGAVFLTRIPEPWFRRIVAAIVLALGVYMLFFKRA